MPSTALSRLLVVALALAGALPLAAPPAGAAAQRLYLLQSDGPDGYWSVDPADPELAAGTAVRTCGELRQVEATAPCWTSTSLVDGRTSHRLPFLPAARRGELRFVSGPIRFHFELAVTPATDLEVRAVLGEDMDDTRSAPAVEVAPGVWEGTLTDAAPLHGEFNTLSVELLTTAPGIKATLRTAGRSWFELPQPLDLRGVPQLRAAEPPLAAPTTYTGGGRTVWFQDSAWSAWSFSGDLSQSRTFEIPQAGATRVLLAWVEAFDTPPVYDLLRGGSADPREMENSPGLTVFRGEEVIADGSNSGARFRGTDAAAALDVPAGPLQVQVEPVSWDPDGGGQELAYTVHVIAVHGERTLQGMRWRGGVAQDMRLPFVAACLYPFEPVPVTRDVTTYTVSVKADTEAQPMAGWTLSYEIGSLGEFPCGEMTSGSQVRFLPPGRDGVALVGPAPRQGTTFVSQGDTVFEFQVDYTYTAPPA